VLKPMFLAVENMLPVIILSAALAGCVTNQRAPVTDRTPAPMAKVEVATPSTPTAKEIPKTSATKPADTRATTHVVQKGETLYSIARQYGLNYQELGAWNNLANANALREGAELQLTSPSTRGGQPGATALPISIDAPPEGKPSPESVILPPPPPKVEENQPDAMLKSDPKASRTPYSEAALQKIQRGESASSPENSPEPKPNPATPIDNESLQWVWPANGKIISSFSESSKGLDIAGVHGQPVVAGADGRVSYIGNSLRGYGKMIVIIHNKSHLSLYAHNSAILVKEGQTVTKGQKIAEMGNSDAENGTVKLHFEIRRLGKPVDPSKYLPSERS
jgi:lipoprotein NlpD